MFLALARDDRAAEKPASAAGAVLRVRLARLLLTDMEMLRGQGVSTWRKSYDGAVTLVNQAIMALAAREAGLPHIEALLVQVGTRQAGRGQEGGREGPREGAARAEVDVGRACSFATGQRYASITSIAPLSLFPLPPPPPPTPLQAELMLADPTHIKDLRPRLKKVEKVLLAAEEMAVRFHAEATPRDLAPRCVTPTARLLARVRCRLAEVQLAAAEERERLAGADREKARPKFPHMRGKRDVQVRAGACRRGLLLLSSSCCEAVAVSWRLWLRALGGGAEAGTATRPAWPHA